MCSGYSPEWRSWSAGCTDQEGPEAPGRKRRCTQIPFYDVETIYWRTSSSVGKLDLSTSEVADGLVKVQVALGNIASKRERVKILYKKIEDLIKYLDPEYIDRIAIPEASKLQFILAEEPFVLSQVALLEQVSTLVPVLDSASIKAVPEHAARLQRLAQIHIEQQDQCAGITEESKALLEEYNKTIMLLSKQFVQWDDLLCQLEAAKQVKPAEE